MIHQSLIAPHQHCQLGETCNLLVCGDRPLCLTMVAHVLL